jgi:DNA topoisomerase I
MTVLVISEKDIAAKQIAGHLADGGKLKTTKSGKAPVYSFKRDGDTWSVIGLKGHLVKLDYPSEYRNWYKVAPKDLIWVEPQKKVERGKKDIMDALKKLGKEAEKIIVATDYDREGELIGVEALDVIKASKSKAPVFRARFSSLTKKEVDRSFKNLVEVDHNLAAAAESRQHVDLAWGAALTRILSLASRTSAREVLSVGRVQSPTLALLVDKEKEIRAFIPEPYWEISADIGGKHPFRADHANGRFTDEAEADRVFAKVEGAKSATVTAFDTKPKTEAAPSPFNTTSFQMAASNIGMTAARAMEVAEALYMAGYISYPRTDNTVYPKDENLEEILEGIATLPEYGKLVAQLKEVRRPEPTRGNKTATDHPPIHPVEAPKGADLSQEEWRVYDLVVRRFLATLAQDAKGESLAIQLDIQTEPFKATGYRVTFPGWKAFYPFSGSEERPLAEATEGDKLPVTEIHVERKMTKPPRRYGQGGLIAEMERLGLGTKSTRHEIIRRLSQRDYVKSPSELEPTETAFAVMDALERYAQIIAKPDMTAELEAEMEKVADGSKKFEEVVDASRKMLAKAVEVLEKNKEQLGKEIGEALRKASRIGPCPRCGKDLIVRVARKTRKRFIGCSGWPECIQTYPLPQMGRLESKETSCDACGSPELRLYKRGRPPWEFCANMDCPKRQQAPKEPEGEVEEEAVGDEA